MIQYKCSKCGSAVAAENEKAGKTDTCPNCGNVNTVPPGAVAGGEPQGQSPQAPSPEAPAPSPEPAAAPKPESPPPGEPAPAPPPMSTPTGVMPDKDARMWGMFCHLAGLLVFAQVVPFANVVAPLIIWLIQKEKSPFVDDQGKESLNFQITVSIALLASAVLFIVLIGIPLLIAVIVADVVFIIMAAMKANAGERYRYPFCIRFIK